MIMSFACNQQTDWTVPRNVDWVVDDAFAHSAFVRLATKNTHCWHLVSGPDIVTQPLDICECKQEQTNEIEKKERLRVSEHTVVCSNCRQHHRGTTSS